MSSSIRSETLKKLVAKYPHAVGPKKYTYGPSSASTTAVEYDMPYILRDAYMPVKDKDECSLLPGRHWKEADVKEDCYGNLWYMPGHCAKGSQCATKEDKDAMKAKCLKAAQTLDKAQCKILGNRWLDIDGVAIYDSDTKGCVVTNGLCMPTHCNFSEECKERNVKCEKKCGKKRRSGSRKRRAARRTSRK